MRRPRAPCRSGMPPHQRSRRPRPSQHHPRCRRSQRSQTPPTQHFQTRQRSPIPPCLTSRSLGRLRWRFPPRLRHRLRHFPRWQPLVPRPPTMLEPRMLPRRSRAPLHRRTRQRAPSHHPAPAFHPTPKERFLGRRHRTHRQGRLRRAPRASKLLRDDLSLSDRETRPRRDTLARCTRPTQCHGQSFLGRATWGGSDARPR